MANVLFIRFKQHLIVGVCVYTCMFMCVMIHILMIWVSLLHPSFSPQHVISHFCETCQVLKYLYTRYSFISNMLLTVN